MEDNQPLKTVKKNNKIQEYFEINFPLKGNSRKILRDQIITKFLDEKKGYWKNNIQHVTMCSYFVEKLLNKGNRIYLLRPTYLNKGIDFQVWVETLDTEGDYRPSHQHIFEDLRIKQKDNKEQFSLLIKAIDRVWNCEEPDDILKDTNLDFKEGYTVELLLKILKWLFIEQDVTYWNYDGRAMLKIGIDKEFSNS